MKSKKYNHQRRIHPQSNPQTIDKGPGEERNKHERIAKRELKARKSDSDILEDMDHPE